MAATKYSIVPSDYLTVINQIETALNAKGLITSTLYKASGHLIFNTPLTNKVIKISTNTGMDDILVYYGDAWTSGSTITNQVRIGLHIAGTQHVPSAIDVIADTNFFALIWQTNSTDYIGYFYVGALSNGNALIFAMTRYYDAGYGAGICYAVNLTTGVALFPITLSGQGFKDASGNIYTMPLMWADAGNLLQLDNGSPAGTVGVKLTSVMGTNIVSGGIGYILLPSMYYTYGAYIRCSQILEYTP